MICTIKTKIRIFFLVILFIFINLSAIISFTISQKILFNSYIIAKENEMAIVVDDIKDVKNDLMKDIDIFSNGLKAQIYKTGKRKDETQDIRSFINDINSYLKSILYSREFIKSFIYVEENFNIAVSLEEGFVYKSLGLKDIDGGELNLSKDDMVKILDKMEIPVSQEHIVFSKIENNKYIVAVIDMQGIIKQTKKI